MASFSLRVVRAGWRSLGLVGICAGISAYAPNAFAQEQAPTPAGTVTAPAAPPPLPPPPVTAAATAPSTVKPQGLAVVAVGATKKDAFDVARALYASRLRPLGLDEAKARALAGEVPSPDAPRDVKDVAEIRASIGGDDAPSRRLLGGLAKDLALEGFVLVRTDPVAQPSAAEARVFVADGAGGGEVDAARYLPDPTTAPWASTVASLERRWAPPPAAPAPILAPAAVLAPAPAVKAPGAEGEARPFYTSAWFWGAVAAAAIIGGGFYLASRDSSDQPIHLQMRVGK